MDYTNILRLKHEFPPNFLRHWKVMAPRGIQKGGAKIGKIPRGWNYQTTVVEPLCFCFGFSQASND